MNELGRRLFLLSALTSGAARAQTVIAAGNEARVLALFAPHRLGEPIVPGWTLWNVSIRASEIEIELRGTGGESASVTLVRDRSLAEHSESFGVVRTASAASGPGARAADELVAALRRNDRGGLWTELGRAPAERQDAFGDRRARGIYVPFCVAAVAVAFMLLVRFTSRRGRERSTRRS